MNVELTMVLGLLAAAVAMFAANRPRMDAVALLMLALLYGKSPSVPLLLALALVGLLAGALAALAEGRSAVLNVSLVK